MPHQRRSQQPSAVRMPLLRYFLSAGCAPTFGLFVVSAYLGPPPAERSANVAKIATAASLVKLEPARPAGK